MLYAAAGQDKAAKGPSLQECVFGLKLFSRAGRAILDHHRKDARASYDSLSLAVSCFDRVSAMATSGNREAADQLKGLIDNTFDAISMLSNAASLFGEVCDGNGANSPSTQGDKTRVEWQSLVLKCLAQVDTFIVNNVGGSQSTPKVVTLQRFLPSLAILCYKVSLLLLFLFAHVPPQITYLRYALSVAWKSFLEASRLHKCHQCPPHCSQIDQLLSQ